MPAAPTGSLTAATAKAESTSPPPPRHHATTEPWVNNDIHLLAVLTLTQSNTAEIMNLISGVADSVLSQLPPEG